MQVSYTQNPMYFYRHSPSSEDCLVDTTPLPPDPIDLETILISDFRLVNGRLSLEVEWIVPEVTYGEIVGSELRVTTTPVSSSVVQSSTAVTVLQIPFQEVSCPSPSPSF